MSKERERTSATSCGEEEREAERDGEGWRGMERQAWCVECLVRVRRGKERKQESVGNVPAKEDRVVFGWGGVVEVHL
eukprot:2266891-Rhodomonas_salina.1